MAKGCSIGWVQELDVYLEGPGFGFYCALQVLNLVRVEWGECGLWVGEFGCSNLGVVEHADFLPYIRDVRHVPVC